MTSAGQTRASVVLPVSSSGVDHRTAELPTCVVAIQVRCAQVRGALVPRPRSPRHQPLSRRSPARRPRGRPPRHGSSSTDTGRVVARPQATGLGKPVERHALPHRPTRRLAPRQPHRRHRRRPALGWRVVFRENRAQFDGGLSGPLQTGRTDPCTAAARGRAAARRVLVRRLHVAREQQRRLRELTRSQAEFISVVSHELRTPVAGVLGFLQTTVDHWDALSDADRLEHRAPRGHQRPPPAGDDPRRARHREHRVRAASATPSTASSSAAELETAVEASNDADASRPARSDRRADQPATRRRRPRPAAAGARATCSRTPARTPPAGRSSVETSAGRRRAGRRGAGLGRRPRRRASSPDALERIFDKFVRGNDNAVTGTGLGLYIVRSIVEAHHGRIWCESDPGRRTAFIFELPLVGAPVTAVTCRPSVPVRSSRERTSTVDAPDTTRRHDPRRRRRRRHAVPGPRRARGRRHRGRRRGHGRPRGACEARRTRPAARPDGRAAGQPDAGPMPGSRSPRRSSRPSGAAHRAVQRLPRRRHHRARPTALGVASCVSKGDAMDLPQIITEVVRANPR